MCCCCLGGFFSRQNIAILLSNTVCIHECWHLISLKTPFCKLEILQKGTLLYIVILFRFHNIISAVDRKKKSIRHMFKCVAKSIVTNTMWLDFSKFYLYTYPGLSSISLCIALNKYVGFVGGLMQICIARVYLTDYSLCTICSETLPHLLHSKPKSVTWFPPCCAVIWLAGQLIWQCAIIVNLTYICPRTMLLSTFNNEWLSCNAYLYLVKIAAQYID